MTATRPMPSSLSAELHQQAPFHGPEEEAYLSVQRTADGLRRQLADLLKEHGLTPSQYNVLRILRGAGTAGQLTGAIGERLVVQDPDVPRLLDRMEKREWIVRRREDDDRRCVRVMLTRPGRKLVKALDLPVQALHIAQWTALGRTKVRALLQSLAAVCHRGNSPQLTRNSPATHPQLTRLAVRRELRIRNHLERDDVVERHPLGALRLGGRSGKG